MSDEAVRKEFEAWMENQPELKYGCEPPTRTKRGYAYGPTDIAWMGWQARGNAERSAAIQECAAIVRARANRTVTRGSLNAAAEEILALKER